MISQICGFMVIFEAHSSIPMVVQLSAVFGSWSSFMALLVIQSAIFWNCGRKGKAAKPVTQKPPSVPVIPPVTPALASVPVPAPVPIPVPAPVPVPTPVPTPIVQQPAATKPLGTPGMVDILATKSEKASTTKLATETVDKKKKQEEKNDSFNEHKPVEREAKRTGEIKASRPVPRNREDYKTLNRVNMPSSDFDKTMSLDQLLKDPKKANAEKPNDEKQNGEKKQEECIAKSPQKK
ncbi:hypothetical protein M3Y96_00148200 [Aphelenchoides besseyi]|nr:hypothetical protein M3Y96_00148200 [Aphelenchoides besseyi]